MRKKILIYIILFFLLAYNSQAFLISPPKIDMPFQPGLTQEYIITLYNNRQETVNLETYVKYDFLPPEAQALVSSVQLDTSTISFTPSDQTKEFKATVNLPSSIPEGAYDIRIGAVEEAVSGVVGSRSANEVRLVITYGVPVETQPTTSVKKRLEEEELGSQPGLPGSQKPSSGVVVPSKANFTLQVVTTFIVTFLFLILLVLFYILLRKRAEALSIISFDARYQHLDSNVKIEAIIRNKSFEVINDIYIDFQIIDADQNIIKTINTGPIKLKPASEGVIARLWEAKEAKSGEYAARALLYYHKKALMKMAKFSIL